MIQELDSGVTEAKLQQAWGGSSALSELTTRLSIETMTGRMPACPSEVYQVIGDLMAELHAQHAAGMRLQDQYFRSRWPAKTETTITVAVGEEVVLA